jgi:hypothetical protein
MISALMGGATHDEPATEGGPVLAEPAPLPTKDSVRGHDHESLPPPCPQAG